MDLEFKKPRYLKSLKSALFTHYQSTFAHPIVKRQKEEKRFQNFEEFYLIYFQNVEFISLKHKNFLRESILANYLLYRETQTFRP